jgi:hypothetical protein
MRYLLSRENGNFRTTAFLVLLSFVHLPTVWAPPGLALVSGDLQEVWGWETKESARQSRQGRARRSVGRRAEAGSS